jgi:phosphinothricin acetyltransferase
VADIYNVWVRQGGTMDTVEKTADDFRTLVDGFSKREAILVAEQGLDILGWGIIKHYSDRPGYRVCCETSVYLRPDCLRKGYGSALKRVLLKRCRDYGYHHLLARIWADNEASIEYNKRFGYETVGIQREVGHRDGKWRDVCIMQLVLEDVPPYRPDLGYPSGPNRSE